MSVYICACALIVLEDGKVLSVSRKHDTSDCGLPGGKLDEGETHEEALVREVLEETGLTVEIRKDLPYFEYTYLGYCVRAYKVTVLPAPVQPVKEGEGVIRYLTPSELLANSNFREYYERVFQFFNLI